MSNTERSCPQCQSHELEQEHLTQKGSVWPILFGRELFKKKTLLAHACRKCGFVFLSLGPAADE
ncbi:MAG: hypothetical protein ACYTGZ_06550 [Planctomycetota bacterium]|jgi:predicted nucleic-acid-binding Zn-ribbon protein